MKKIVIMLGAIVLVGSVVYWLVSSRDHSSTSSDKIRVVATFYPLAHFAEQVGGDFAEVVNITPAGTEPHDFEPSPRQLAQIYAADVFLVNGAGLDPWAEKIKQEVASRGVRVVVMSDNFSLMQQTTTEDDEHGLDPHVWLDPVMASAEVQYIRDALKASDPAHEANYDTRATLYTDTLQTLDQEYQQALSSCRVRDLVTSHAAFAYLAKRYGLTQIAIAGISPEAEPSPARLAEIATLVKQKNLKHIFMETLVSPKLAETIARETGASTLTLNPLEGLTAADVLAGKTYATVMAENLNQLRVGLQCI